MPAFKDLTGRRFGMLTVEELLKDRDPNGQIRYLCRCECGREVVKIRSYLSNEHIRSCGCVKPHVLGGRDRSPENQGYGRWKTELTSRHHTTTLTFDQWIAVVTRNCEYCGSPPMPRLARHYNTTTYLGNGIDRIDSKKEYDIDNCVPCCTICNRMKRDHSLLEFKHHIQRIHRHLNLKDLEESIT